MKYCARCLQPNTRPNTSFTKDGVCPACNYFDQLGDVDWDERIETLEALIKKYRGKGGQRHDCIIGVSGGKDSTRQALWVRDKLGLNPLLVCLTYPPEQVTERGVENLSNLAELGFDLHVLSPAPQTWKNLKRVGFEKFANSFRSTELALFSTVPRLAIRYEIPLILWGENPGLQLGDLKTLGKTGYDGNNLRYMNTLDGGGTEWMIDAGFEERDLLAYKYPDPTEFEKSKIQIVYLGWFLKDWSILDNALVSCSYGLNIRSDSPEKTSDLYGVYSLDEDFVTLNQMIKYYKYGFGRATDYLNEEIRWGRISRQDAIPLVERYDGCCGHEYIQQFCDYLDMSLESFWSRVVQNVNKELFTVSGSRDIQPRFKVGSGLQA